MFPKLVLTPTQTDLGCRTPSYERFAVRESRASAVILFQERTPMATIPSTISRIPSEPNPGKMRPAAVSGDAHPMMPIGGMVVKRSATGKRHHISFRSRTQRMIHGAARMPLALAQDRML